MRNTVLGFGSSLIATGAGARIEVLLNEEIGAISPNIYGHFTQHLGGVVYDGTGVGEGSQREWNPQESPRCSAENSIIRQQAPRSSDPLNRRRGAIRQRHDAHSPGHSRAQHARRA